MANTEQQIGELKDQITQLKEAQKTLTDMLLAQATKVAHPQHLDVTLPQFRGDLSDKDAFDDWCAQYEASGTAARWDQRMLGEKFPGFLAGDALREFFKLPVTTQADYKMARDALKKVLLPASLRQTATAQLNLLRQQPGESVQELLRKVKELGRRVFLDENAQSDFNLLMCFVQALRPEIGRMMPPRPASLLEAAADAQILEARLAAEAKPTTTKATKLVGAVEDTSTYASQFYAGQVPYWQPQVESSYGQPNATSTPAAEQAAQLVYYVPSNTQQYVRQGRGGAQRGGGLRQDFGRDQQGQLTCAKCGVRNHHANECRQTCWCRICNQQGHISTICPQAGQSRQTDRGGYRGGFRGGRFSGGNRPEYPSFQSQTYPPPDHGGNGSTCRDGYRSGPRGGDVPFGQQSISSAPTNQNWQQPLSQGPPASQGSYMLVPPSASAVPSAPVASSVTTTVERVGNLSISGQFMVQSPDPVHIKGLIAGVPTIMLVDSGSGFSIISTQMADGLPKNLVRRDDDSLLPRAHSISNHGLEFVATVEAEVVIGDRQVRHKFLVLGDCPTPCLLGRDIIKKLSKKGDHSLDWNQHRVTFGTTSVQMFVVAPDAMSDAQLVPTIVAADHSKPINQISAVFDWPKAERKGTLTARDHTGASENQYADGSTSRVGRIDIPGIAERQLMTHDRRRPFAAATRSTTTRLSVSVLACLLCLSFLARVAAVPALKVHNITESLPRNVRLNPQYSAVFRDAGYIDGSQDFITHHFVLPLQLFRPSSDRWPKWPLDTVSDTNINKAYNEMRLLHLRLAVAAEKAYNVTNVQVRTYFQDVQRFLSPRFVLDRDKSPARSQPEDPLDAVVSTVQKALRIPNNEVRERARARRSIFSGLICLIEIVFGSCEGNSIDAASTKTALRALQAETVGLSTRIGVVDNHLISLSKLTADGFKIMDRNVDTLRHAVDALTSLQEASRVLQERFADQLDRTSVSAAKSFHRMVGLTLDSLHYLATTQHWNDQLRASRNLLSSIVQLNQGFLSVDLVPPQALRESLVALSQQLSTKSSHVSLTYPIDDLSTYYKLPLVAHVSATSQDVQIALRVPLTHADQDYTAYSIQFGQLATGTDGMIMEIRSPYSIIAFNRPNTHYMLLTAVQWQQCAGGRVKQCAEAVPVLPIDVETCELAVFRHASHITVERLCEVTLSHDRHAVQAIHLADALWYIAVPDVGDWRVTCDEDDAPDHVDGCQQCVIRLPCQCGLVMQRQSLPRRFHGRCSSHIDVKYSFNPYLRDFAGFEYNYSSEFVVESRHPTPNASKLADLHEYLRTHLQTAATLQLNFTKFAQRVLRSDHAFRSIDEASQRRIDTAIENIKDNASQSLIYIIAQAALDVVLLASLIALAITVARSGSGPTFVLPPAQTQQGTSQGGTPSLNRNSRARFRRKAPPPPYTAPTASPIETEELVGAVYAATTQDLAENQRLFQYLNELRRDTSAPPRMYPVLTSTL